MSDFKLIPVGSLETEEAIAEQLLRALDHMDEMLAGAQGDSITQRRLLLGQLPLVEYIEALQVRWVEVCCGEG